MESASYIPVFSTQDSWRREVVLYAKRPTATHFRTDPADAMQYSEFAFLGLCYIALMVVAIVLATIGSSTVKRAPTDRKKNPALVRHRGPDHPAGDPVAPSSFGPASVTSCIGLIRVPACP